MNNEKDYLFLIRDLTFFIQMIIGIVAFLLKIVDEKSGLISNVVPD